MFDPSCCLQGAAVSDRVLHHVVICHLQVLIPVDSLTCAAGPIAALAASDGIELDLAAAVGQKQVWQLAACPEKKLPPPLSP